MITNLPVNTRRMSTVPLNGTPVTFRPGMMPTTYSGYGTMQRQPIILNKTLNKNKKTLRLNQNLIPQYRYGTLNNKYR